MTAAVLPDLTHLTAAHLAARTYRADVRPDIQLGSTEIYITRPPAGPVVVTWRGSTDFADWRRNARFCPWYARELGCVVHQGFLDCHRETWPALLDWLKASGYPPVHLIGHSKGAAEATLAAAHMTRLGLWVGSLTTFGCPRVGFGGALGRLLARGGFPIRRVVHGADAVPHTPPWFLGWRHVVKPVHVSRPDPIADHCMAAYQAALRAAAATPETAP